LNIGQLGWPRSATSESPRRPAASIAASVASFLPEREMIQALISLAVLAIIAARAINTL
jgi:hypothetical protein